MRNVLILAALAALSLPVSAATPTETVAAFHQALAAGDATRAIALLAPTVEIYESGHVERSRDEYAAHHLGADVQYARATTNRVLRQNEQVSGSIAVVLRETETTGTYAGRGVHQFGTETAVLKKEGDGWLITHFHWSSRKGE
jgi:ketosteroid isomerase-like protein